MSFLPVFFQNMGDGYLRLAGDQGHRLYIIVAVAGLHVLQVLGEARAVLDRFETALAFVQRGQGGKFQGIVIVALEDADAGLEETPSHAGFFKSHRREFLYRAADRAAGMFGAGRVLAVVAGIGDKMVEPISVEILALVSDMEHHPGVIEAGALIELLLAGRIDLGGDQAVGDLHMREVFQRRGGKTSRLGVCRAANAHQPCDEDRRALHL